MGKQWLIHPLLHDLDLDSKEYFIAQREVLERKKFLQRIYRDFYLEIRALLPERSEKVVELGSGAGKAEDFISQVIKTDVFHQPFANLVFDAMEPPFQTSSLDAVVFVDVFHHIPDVMRFLKTTHDVLRKGGRIIMIEPWFTPWSKFVYTRLHREPLDWKTGDWKFDSSGPISGANQALPWIVFHRDRPIFVRAFPDLQVIKLQPMMPFRYILSGGVSSWVGLPEIFYQPVKNFEQWFKNQMSSWAMFAIIALEKVR